MKLHPFSEAFPLIEGTAFDELVLDIKTNGVREKIWLDREGRILDGRNRYLACQKLKIKAPTRVYHGKDLLAFVISQNIHRRHLTESQRAMVAGAISLLKPGAQSQTRKFAGLTQSQAAESLNVSERSVQSARKVHESGSKPLLDAVRRGDVSVSKAASVVDLPKSDQLAAATRSKPASKDEPERDDSAADNEEAHLEAVEREYSASIEKVMDSDDKLAAAHVEIKRQAAEIATLKVSRDGFQNGKAEIVRLLQAEQRKTAKLEKQIQKLESENERLTERIAIREAS